MNIQQKAVFKGTSAEMLRKGLWILILRNIFIGKPLRINNYLLTFKLDYYKSRYNDVRSSTNNH